MFSSNLFIIVDTSCLPKGGVFKIEISLSFDSAIFRLLGIGVADIARESILFLNCLIFSLSATQNLCSSSIIISHKSLKFILSLSNLCVQMIKSISQQASFFKISASFLGVSSLVNTSIFNQKFLNLSKAFSKCS
jgi:hypothetical protein